jgi:hypothetical protein
MRSNRNRRILVLVVAVAASAAVQACAVTTGGFVPSRDRNSNGNMNSKYDVLRMQSMPATPHSLMRTTSEKGFHDHVYY